MELAYGSHEKVINVFLAGNQKSKDKPYGILITDKDIFPLHLSSIFLDIFFRTKSSCFRSCKGYLSDNFGYAI